MKDLRALWFLAFRSWINSIRRSFSLPRRQLGVILTVGLLVLGLVGNVIRIALGAGAPSSLSIPLPAGWQEWVSLGAFVLFALPLIFLAVGCTYLGSSYRKADADVLFATPVSPKLLLVLLILRSSGRPLFWGAVSLIVYVAQGRSLLEQAGEESVSLSLIGEFGFYFSLAYLLGMVAWRTMTTSIALTLARDEPRWERPRFIAGILAAAGFLVPLVIGSLVVAGYGHQVLAVLRDPSWRRWVFLGWLGEGVATGIPFGRPDRFVWGVLGYLGIGMVCGTLMMRQAGWLTDIASRTAFFAGEREATLTEQQAVLNPKRRNRLRRAVARLNVRGLWAIAWRQALQPLHYILYIVFAVVIGGLPLLVKDITPMLIQMLFPGLLSQNVSPLATMLQRIDLVRALPFPTRSYLLAEIGVRAIPVSVAGLLVGTGWLIAGVYPLRPLLTGMSAFISLVVLWNVVSASVFVWYPDVHDQTQRGIRTLAFVGMLALVIGAYAAILLPLAFLTRQGVWIAAGMLPIVAVFGWWAFGLIADRFDEINPAE